MAGLSFDLIALQLFAGLALGAIYVLFGIGLSLIFGMLTVVNFAHGAFFMVGAYVGVYILILGGNFWICLIAVPLAVGLFGLAVERILIRPLYGRGIDKVRKQKTQEGQADIAQATALSPMIAQGFDRHGIDP